MKPRFSIRTLLAVMVVVGVATVISGIWWTRPFTVKDRIGNYPPFFYDVRYTTSGDTVHSGPIIWDDYSIPDFDGLPFCRFEEGGELTDEGKKLLRLVEEAKPD